MRLEYNTRKNIANNPKIAAVLALFYPNQENKVSLLLTKRANYNGTHSGQISFPGGKVEISDQNLKETAQRNFRRRRCFEKRNSCHTRNYRGLYSSK